MLPARHPAPLAFRTRIRELLIAAALLAILLTGQKGEAASYQQQNSTLIDPIQDIFGQPHTYSGIDLGPGVQLDQVDLHFADLDSADLSGSTLTHSNLHGIDLDHADLSLANLSASVLTSANLRFADLTGANLSETDFSGARFANAVGLDQTLGLARYSHETDFGLTGFDPVEAGWLLVAIPEPGTALLLGLGGIGLCLRARSS